jgi:hypothetical protein
MRRIKKQIPNATQDYKLTVPDRLDANGHSIFIVEIAGPEGQRPRTSIYSPRARMKQVTEFGNRLTAWSNLSLGRP